MKIEITDRIATGWERAISELVGLTKRDRREVERWTRGFSWTDERHLNVGFWLRKNPDREYHVYMETIGGHQPYPQYHTRVIKDAPESVAIAVESAIHFVARTLPDRADEVKSWVWKVSCGRDPLCDKKVDVWVGITSKDANEMNLPAWNRPVLVQVTRLMDDWEIRAKANSSPYFPSERSLTYVYEFVDGKLMLAEVNPMK